MIRGVALSGVLMVNLLTGFRLSLFEHYFRPAREARAVDRAVEVVLGVALESKAFILFSTLFGIGLAAQQEHASRAGVDPVRFLVRRLVVLLAIGLVHLLLVWNGDILVEYAVAGLLAVPLFWQPPRRALLVAIALIAIYLSPLPSRIPAMFDGWLSGAALDAHIAVATSTYQNGSWTEIQAFRVHECRYIAALLISVLPRTIALILLGNVVWKHGIVRDPDAHRPLLIATAVIGFTLAAIDLVCTLTGRPLGERFANGGNSIAEIGKIAVAFAYGAALLLALSGKPIRAAGTALAAVGRMAFTNYLTQSLVLGALFYGYGLGLFGRLHPAGAAAIAIALFAVQAAVSVMWLSRFEFGPVEWLWRSLTYRAMQPMRRLR